MPIVFVNSVSLTLAEAILLVMSITTIASQQRPQVWLCRKRCCTILLICYHVPGKENIAHVQAEAGLQEIATTINNLAECRLLLIEFSRHPHELLAHSWEQKGDRAINALFDSA